MAQAHDDIAIPRGMDFLFDPPLGAVRYRVAYGGRGGTKSWNYARALLLHGAGPTPIRILCAREFQSSIADSVKKLLEDQADLMGLGGFYRSTRTSITGRNGTEFIFRGLRRNIKEIKSTEGIDICWVEEAEAVSEESWRVLTPTIRQPRSEIWVTFNPALRGDPTYQRFVEHPPSSAIVRKVLYRDNPFLPQVLRDEAREMAQRDPEAYAHVWGGEPWRRSDAEVLSGLWRVDDFDIHKRWDGPYFGADWGFARDPTVLVKLYVGDRRLWVDAEERGVGWNFATMAKRFRRIEGADKYVVRGDPSRPETINELRETHGLRVEAAPAWSGSVEDGVEYLRSFDEIVIRPRCKGMIEEARLWRYKVDPQTEDVLPKLEDGYDHGWDAARYALAPLIKKDDRPRADFR